MDYGADTAAAAHVAAFSRVAAHGNTVSNIYLEGRPADPAIASAVAEQRRLALEAWNGANRAAFKALLKEHEIEYKRQVAHMRRRRRGLPGPEVEEVYADEDLVISDSDGSGERDPEVVAAAAAVPAAADDADAVEPSPQDAQPSLPASSGSSLASFDVVAPSSGTASATVVSTPAGDGCETPASSCRSAPAATRGPRVVRASAPPPSRPAVDPVEGMTTRTTSDLLDALQENQTASGEHR